MPVPVNLSDLSTTEGSNFPQSTDSPSSLDDTQRAHGAFIAQLRDGSHIVSATAKTTLVDADFFPMNDSAASSILKKITWANIKAALAGLYQPVGSYAASGANADITSLTALTAGGLPDSSVLTADIANSAVTPAKLSQPLTLGTSVATTSGTSVGFTGIPSWVKRITISYSGISTNGSSDIVFRIGNGSYISSGYVGGTLTIPTSTPAGTVWTSGALLTHAGGVSAGALFHGTMVLTLLDAATNRWVFDGTANRSDANAAYIQSGNLTLSGSLDRVQIATVNATDTFDAGLINTLYEG